MVGAGVRWGGSIYHPEFSGRRGERAGGAGSRTRRPRSPPPLTSRTSSSGNPGAAERTSRRFHQPPARGSDRGNLKRPRGRSSRSAAAGRGRPGARGAELEPSPEPQTPNPEQLVAGGAGGLRANRLSSRSPGALPARGGPLPASLREGNPGGGFFQREDGLLDGAPLSPAAGAGTQGGADPARAPALRPLAWPAPACTCGSRSPSAPALRPCEVPRMCPPPPQPPTPAPHLYKIQLSPLGDLGLGDGLCETTYWKSRTRTHLSPGTSQTSSKALNPNFQKKGPAGFSKAPGPPPAPGPPWAPGPLASSRPTPAIDLQAGLGWPSLPGTPQQALTGSSSSSLLLVLISNSRGEMGTYYAPSRPPTSSKHICSTPDLAGNPNPKLPKQQRPGQEEERGPAHRAPARPHACACSTGTRGQAGGEGADLRSTPAPWEAVRRGGGAAQARLAARLWSINKSGVGMRRRLISERRVAASGARRRP
ncbi:collagen alpha-1(III) chain-like [Eubalaena glacialis]|uniref:collagen alpha-1(III) chain-like n=1 Tax=Eubalaena glacialis TaxID=27606 RepID=UPI002A5A1378|nr:collagen alpha-1(III) chain-like [Eubalaena glacialis]